MRAHPPPTFHAAVSGHGAPKGKRQRQFSIPVPKGQWEQQFFRRPPGAAGGRQERQILLLPVESVGESRRRGRTTSPPGMMRNRASVLRRAAHPHSDGTYARPFRSASGNRQARNTACRRPGIRPCVYRTGNSPAQRHSRSGTTSSPEPDCAVETADSSKRSAGIRKSAKWRTMPYGQKEIVAGRHWGERQHDDNSLVHLKWRRANFMRLRPNV